MRHLGVKKTILTDFLKGLLVIINKIEKGELNADMTIEASSYFFSKRTAQRFGFTLKKAPLLIHLNTLFNYIDLTWMYSLAHHRLRFPNLFGIKKAIISGNELLKQKEKIQLLLAKIEG